MNKIKLLMKRLYARIRLVLQYIFWGEYKTDEYYIKKMYYSTYGRYPDLDNPQKYSEKIQWLKLHFRQKYQTEITDKYSARDYWSRNFGDEYLIPLAFETTSWRRITMDVIPDYPCIIKPSSGSGDFIIIKDKSKVDIEQLRKTCKKWLKKKYYYISHEWNYKHARQRIIIEKLLQTKDGKIPNDYKLSFINGELQFIYCSVDREGENFRIIYDKNWKRLPFSMSSCHASESKSHDIPKPATLDKMIEIGSEVAKLFCLVRVDFYDVDGKLYYGEVTMYHGGGYEQFDPPEIDDFYGAKVDLNYVKMK